MTPANVNAGGARLPLLDQPSEPVAVELLDTIRARTGRILNLHRMMAHAPAMMKASYETAMVIRHDLSLPRPLVELMIMRTAQLAKSNYEWHQHAPMALANGLSQEKIDALSAWPASPLFNDAERAALSFCDSTVAGTDPTPEDFSRLQQHYTPRKIVEIAMLVSQYFATALFIHALGIPVEEGK